MVCQKLSFYRILCGPQVFLVILLSTYLTTFGSKNQAAPSCMNNFTTNLMAGAVTSLLVKGGAKNFGHNFPKTGKIEIRSVKRLLRVIKCSKHNLL